MDMRLKYQNEMVELNNELLKMAIIVRESLDRSLESLVTQNIVLAKNIIESDSEIDLMELELCDKCAVLIATEQPVARDLRVIVGALKIVTDLERMADLACHVAKSTITLKDKNYTDQIDLISEMVEIAGNMTKDSIIAFIHQDGKLAEEVAARDDLIDDLYNKVTKRILKVMIENPEEVEVGLNLIFLSRSIERYADHAENICEWVVYTSTGIHKEL
ncbi:MAG: phosphate transport system regulatory protein PhoU [Spirochaetaceae bacterium 4572_7]|nr:MAG: phosphate transport system regulatory protein PhoU [Spirochaetaceae bacterium 4572_7]